MFNRMFLSAPHMGGDELPLVEDVFRSNWIAPTGPMVDAFEQDLAALTGMAHVAALSSGTAALHLALRLSGVEKGDEVWGTTMTFIGGVAPILYAEATPVFFDVDPGTFLLDLDLVEERLRVARTAGRLPKVVVTTDLYGHVIDGARVNALRDEYGFIWIRMRPRHLAPTVTTGMRGREPTSRYCRSTATRSSPLPGGGALASDDGGKIAAARFLSTQARDPAPHYEHTTYGYNYRLSNVCAAIGVGQLRVLQSRVARRRAINTLYREELGRLPGFTFSPESEGMRANRWLTTVLIDPQAAGTDRESVRLALEAVDIESRPLWKPMHLQPVFAGVPYQGGNVAERAFADGLCLPSGSAMTDADVTRVCTVIEGVKGR